MNKYWKSALALVLAIALVAGVTLFTKKNALKASENDGHDTAAERKQ